MDYRNKINYSVIGFPIGFEEERRLKCPPCSDCKQLVLAHASEIENYKNDKTGVFLKKGLETDVINFIMEDENDVVISNLGAVGTFPNDSKAVGFIYDWTEILNTYGAGCYKIKIDFVIGGVAGGYTYGLYRLKDFTVESARRTVKIHTSFDSYNEKEKIDFTGSNFVDSVRFHGFFGNRQPKTEISTLISKGRRVEKVTTENLNEYELRTDPVTVCMTRQLIDVHFLNANKMLISDHNSHNHSYLYLDLPVTQQDTPEMTYTDGTRLASLTVLFSDRVKDQRAYYNQK